MQIKSPLTDEILDGYRKILGRHVTVTMDRPIGTTHPKHPNIVYPINYGYVDGLLGGDGEEQDVYVLGESRPLDTFDGIVIAVVHRFDDNECKWVACKNGGKYTADEIMAAINFQEQFYHSQIIM